MNTVDSAEMNDCPECHGTKLKLVTVPSKRDPTRLRETFVHCDCYFADRSVRLLKASQIPARYAHCTLDNIEIVNQSLSSAVSDIKHFVQYYPTEKTGLLLMGRPGIGKTHLAVAAIQYLISQKGIACLFCDYRELLKEIQNTYNASVQITELEILRPIFETEILVLDELGAIRSSDWVWDTVSHILNYRYNEKKTTIITTNFVDGPSRLSEEAKKKPEPVSRNQRDADWAMRDETLADRITDRMYSRLHEMCRIIHIQGSDFRRVAAGFVVRVIPVNRNSTGDFVGVLQARSLQTGDYWSSPPLPWHEIYKHLNQLGQTESQIETIQSVLLRGKTADISEKPEPLKISDYQVRKMQMKLSTSTES
jgi:DNA replication protein DnaC